MYASERAIDDGLDEDGNRRNDDVGRDDEELEIDRRRGRSKKPNWMRVKVALLHLHFHPH